MSAKQGVLERAGGLERLVLVLGTLSILAVTVAAAYVTWRGRGDSIADWRAFNEKYAVAAAAGAEEMLHAVDLAMEVAIERAGQGSSADPAAFRERLSTEAMHATLADIRRQLPQIDVLFVVAANGDLLASSRAHPAAAINLADRPYVRALREDP